MNVFYAALSSGDGDVCCKLFTTQKQAEQVVIKDAVELEYWIAKRTPTFQEAVDAMNSVGYIYDIQECSVNE